MTYLESLKAIRMEALQTSKSIKDIENWLKENAKNLLEKFVEDMKSNARNVLSPVETTFVCVRTGVDSVLEDYLDGIIKNNDNSKAFNLLPTANSIYFTNLKVKEVIELLKKSNVSKEIDYFDAEESPEYPSPFIFDLNEFIRLAEEGNLTLITGPVKVDAHEVYHHHYSIVAELPYYLDDQQLKLTQKPSNN